MAEPPGSGPRRMWRYEEMALLVEGASSGRCTVRVTHAPYGVGARHDELSYDKAELEQLILATEAAAARGCPPRQQGARDPVVARGASEAEGARGPREQEVAGAARDAEVARGARDVVVSRGAKVPPASLEAAGDRLFRALFAGPVREAFLHCIWRVEKEPDTGLRIRLQFDPSLPDNLEVSSLPWELIYRSETRDHLARSARTPVVRYLAVAGPAARAPLPAALRILVVSARPDGTRVLQVGEEARELAAAWSKEPRVEVEVLEEATIMGLCEKLQGAPFHVLHFMGHGDFDAATGRGYLLFSGPRGEAAPVDGPTLGDTLRDYRSSLRLVVLNACATARLARHRGQDPYSGVAAALLMAGLPAVVAMQYPISDRAALAFSRHFYRALASGLPVDAAAAGGRLAVHLDCRDSREWVTPAVFMSVSDGIILGDPVQDDSGGEPKPEPPDLRPEGKPLPGGWRNPRTLLPLLALLSLAVVAGYLWSARGRARQEGIAADAALRHLGEETTVCGYVAAARYVESSPGAPTFLDFEKGFPSEVFRVVIWGSERARFPESPEVFYLRRNVCAKGRIEAYDGKPEIAVRDPAQLTLESP
jgi:hypothetical protein